TRSFEFNHEGATLAARTLRLLLTLRVFPRWHAPTVGEGLRFTFRGARTIERRFLDAYAAEKRALPERAESAENLLTQTGASVRRLDLSELRATVHGLLNPGRPAPPPPDDGESP